MVKATLVNLETGEKIALSPKTDSRCFFLNWFRYKNYDIQFRLDHNNNLGVDPVLDADIRDVVTRKLLKPAKEHHTKKEYSSQTDSTIYTFEFEQLRLLLNFELAFQATATESVIVNDHFSYKLVKG